MSKSLKPRRGTTAEHADFIGQAHEVTYDTDKHTLVTHDGVTPGGFPLLRADQQAAKDEAQDAKFNQYLPRSGGTMTGGIAISTTVALRKMTSDSELSIQAGTSYNDGGMLTMFGVDAPSNPGKVFLYARNKDGSYVPLELSPNGTAKWNYHDILTSAGGALTGNLALANAYAGRDEGAVVFGVGSTWNTGPSLSFYGVKHPLSAGEFILRAGAGSPELHGKPNNSLTWNTFPVLTLVASWRSGANWYRKYSDGWIEQGGTTQNVGNDSTVTVSCHTPFATTDYNIVVTQKSSGTKTDSTGMVLVFPTATSSWRLHNGDNVSAPFMWYACGY